MQQLQMGTNCKLIRECICEWFFFFFSPADAAHYPGVQPVAAVAPGVPTVAYATPPPGYPAYSVPPPGYAYPSGIPSGEIDTLAFKLMSVLRC